MLAGAGAEPVQATLQLVDDHVLAIGVVDAAHAPDHLDDRVERHRASERQRLALHPGRAAAELAAQLV